MRLDLNNKTKILYVSLLILVISILSLLFRDVENIVHQIFNFFAIGRNPVRFYLFSAYFILLGILYIFVGSKTNFKKTIFENKKRILVFLLFLSYLSGFIFHIYLYKKLDIPQNQYLVFFSDGEITSTKLTHNHLYKIVTGYFFEFLAPGSFENLDTGISTKDFVNTKIIFVIIIISLLLFILFLSIYLSVAGRYKNKIILFTLLYSILSFTLLKNIFDGGLFQEQTIIAFILFLVVIDTSLNYQKYFLFFIPATIDLLLFFFNFIDSSDLFISMIVKQLAFVLFFISFIYFLKKNFRDNLRLSILILINGLVLFLTLVFGNISSLMYLNVDLAKEGSYFLSLNKIDDFELVEQIGLSFVYKVYPNDYFHNIGDVLDKYYVNYSFNPIGVPWKTCVPTSPYKKYNFVLASKVPIGDEVLSGKTYNNRISLVENLGGYYRYDIELRINPCLGRSVNIIDNLFKEKIGDFYIYNFEVE